LLRQPPACFSKFCLQRLIFFLKVVLVARASISTTFDGRELLFQLCEERRLLVIRGRLRGELGNVLGREIFVVDVFGCSY